MSEQDTTAQDITVQDNPSDSTTDTEQALQQQIDELKSQLKTAKEAQAYANAESYNAQRRMEAETDKAKKYALQKFAKELLDVVDNLERAIDNATTENNALVEGIQLTHKSLLATLEKHGVSVIDPVGEKFNPELHEAVGVAADTPADTVGQVLQKGYKLHDRAIRPAMVTVGQ